MLQAELTIDWSLIDIKKIEAQALAIAQEYQPEKIILFGSYATGNPTPDSDVDLLIILDTKESTWELSVKISLMLKHSYPMDIIVRTPQDIAKRLRHGDFFIMDIMENGKVLYERTCK